MSPVSRADRPKYRLTLKFDKVRDAWLLDHFAAIPSTHQRNGAMLHALQLGIAQGLPSRQEYVNEPNEITLAAALRVTISTGTADLYQAFINLPIYSRSPWFHAYLKRGLRLQLADATTNPGSGALTPGDKHDGGSHPQPAQLSKESMVMPLPAHGTSTAPSPAAADDDTQFALRALLSAIGSPLPEGQ